MTKKRVMRTALAAGLSFCLYARGSTDEMRTDEMGSPDTVGGTDQPGSPDTGSGGDTTAWGPAAGRVGAVARSRRARRLRPGRRRRADARDAGSAERRHAIVLRRRRRAHDRRDVGGSEPRRRREPGPRGDEPFAHRRARAGTARGQDLARFTDLRPGIEPDLSSYPHEALGMWAWDGGVDRPLQVGAFWSRSPSIPPVERDAGSPTGTTTYDGHAAGLHAAGGAETKFLADVKMSADLDSHTVSGTVSGSRSLAGSALGDGLVVNLSETDFSSHGAPFLGGTTVSGVPRAAANGARGGPTARAGRWAGRSASPCTTSASASWTHSRPSSPRRRPAETPTSRSRRIHEAHEGCNTRPSSGPSESRRPPGPEQGVT